MRTRTLIAIATVAGIAGAVHEHDLAAMYVAIGTGGIIYLLHAIEAKINRLLDHYHLTVGDADIARD
jgi:hypothetical protein